MQRGANTESLSPDTFCLEVSGEPLCGACDRGSVSQDKIKLISKSGFPF